MKILEKNIINIVSDVCNIPKNRIIRNRKATREANVVIARQILVNILWRNFNYTNHNLKDILGYKNHASIVHARHTHDSDYQYNFIYKNFYDKSMEQLGLYISNEDIDASRNLSMKNKIEEQEKEIDKYKDWWLTEKFNREKYQQELITFKKRYIPR